MTSAIDLLYDFSTGAKLIGMSDPLLTLSLEKGLADRKRLPLAHVIAVLEELRQLVSELGKDLQRKAGDSNPQGGFGLELVAGQDGIAFQPGSVRAQVAITEHINTGVLALTSVIDTVSTLDSEDFQVDAAGREFDPRILRRLHRIGRIQKRDHTELQLSLHTAETRKPVSATFGKRAIAAVRSLQAPTFRVDGISLYGRLVQLLDRAQPGADEDEEKGFWGELHSDNGAVWRIQFEPGQVQKASSLFRKEVKVTGTAVNYRAAHPKLICRELDPDPQRDYMAAFDAMFGSEKKRYNADLDTLLKMIHGEE